MSRDSRFFRSPANKFYCFHHHTYYVYGLIGTNLDGLYVDLSREMELCLNLPSCHETIAQIVNLSGKISDILICIFRSSHPRKHASIRSRGLREQLERCLSPQLPHNWQTMGHNDSINIRIVEIEQNLRRFSLKLGKWKKINIAKRWIDLKSLLALYKLYVTRGLARYRNPSSSPISHFTSLTCTFELKEGDAWISPRVFAFRLAISARSSVCIFRTLSTFFAHWSLPLHWPKLWGLSGSEATPSFHGFSLSRSGRKRVFRDATTNRTFSFTTLRLHS